MPSILWAGAQRGGHLCNFQTPECHQHRAKIVRELTRAKPESGTLTHSSNTRFKPYQVGEDTDLDKLQRSPW